MKKILFICLLALFFLPLAASASITVSTPSAGVVLHQGAVQAITWTSDPTDTAARFNISLCNTNNPSVCGSIAKNVAITTPPYSWRKVSKLVNGNSYIIKVSRVGVTDTRSSGIFTIVPPLLTNQRQVLELFKAAMGNRYKDLNANNKTGVAGVYDYIIGDGTYASIKIASTTVNNATPPVYTRTPIAQLDWFKNEFKNNYGSVLNQRDKDGIKYAMAKRYTDFCKNDRVVSINGMTKTYNDNIVAKEILKQQAIKGANSAYDASVKLLAGTSITFKLVNIEKLKIDRDKLINAAYDAFYSATDGYRTTLSDTYGNGLASASGTGIEKAYYDCINNARVTTWWQQ